MKTPPPLKQPTTVGEIVAWGNDIIHELNLFFRFVRSGDWEANSELISHAGRRLNVTLVTDATYTAKQTDDIIDVNRAGAVTITLPAAPKTGRRWRIHDSSGAAGTNNITISSTETIRGVVLIDSDSSAVEVEWNGSVYVSVMMVGVIPPVYTEANWTPVLKGSSTPGTQTYDIQLGRLTRINNTVFFSFRIRLTAKDGATAGDLQIGGLPDASRTLTNFAYVNSLAGDRLNIDTAGGFSWWYGRIGSNSQSISLFQAGDNVSDKPLVAADFVLDTMIIGSGFYFI